MSPGQSIMPLIKVKGFDSRGRSPPNRIAHLICKIKNPKKRINCGLNLSGETFMTLRFSKETLKNLNTNEYFAVQGGRAGETCCDCKETLRTADETCCKCKEDIRIDETCCECKK